MKIVCVDNFDRENIADRLVASGIESVFDCEAMVRGLRLAAGECDWYVMKDDDYVLSKGMEDLI